ncbi:MAG TPA: hypothetical protein VFS09_10010 [Candidatus Eisenbacteria bacterium]|nr:hypothetical protein [Candidatus Eisenbacteria bacterium]
MFQRKLIAVLSVVALFAVTAGTGHASLSRVESMGLGSPVLSQLTEDYVNIYAFPASVVRQNNLVFAEFGNNPGGSVNSVNPQDQSFTLVKNFPRIGVISLQMKQSAQNLNSGPASSSSQLQNNANNEWFDLIWGKAFSKMDFAIRLDVTNSSFEETDVTGGVTTTYKAKGIDFSFDPYPFGGGNYFPGSIDDNGVELNTMGITPSLSLHMSNDNRLDLAATYRTYSLDRSNNATPTAQKWEDGGNASYALNARYFMNKSDASQWYLAGWYRTDDLSWEVTGYDPAVVTADETYKSYGIGISNNLKVNDNNLLVWGLSVWEAKHEYSRGDNQGGAFDVKEWTDKTTMLPVLFAGFETQATSWLKLRVGGNNSIMSYEEDASDFISPANSYNQKQDFTSFDLTLGAGIRFNNLDVDMTMNEGFPFSGGYILSGDQSTPLTRVSATYHF